MGKKANCKVPNFTNDRVRLLVKQKRFTLKLLQNIKNNIVLFKEIWHNYYDTQSASGRVILS